MDRSDLHDAAGRRRGGAHSAAIASIAAQIGCSGETLPKWVRQAERDQSMRAGQTSEERDWIKAPEREVRERVRRMGWGTTTANVTYDVVVPFSGTATAWCRARPRRRRAASVATAAGNVGAVTFSRSGDPDSGEFQEGLMLATFGEVDAGALSG